MIDRLLKRLVPAAALGLAVAGCDLNIDIGDTDGVPLAELDMSGSAPTTCDECVHGISTI